MRRRQEHKAPFVVLKATSMGHDICVAALEVGDGFLCLKFSLGVSQVETFVAKKDDFTWRHKLSDLPLAPQLQELKAKALRHGATLEAIQLLGTLMSLSKPEEATMAQTKLSSKATPDKEGLKAAAKSTPVNPAKKATPAAKADAPAKPKGNVAALQKAREARAAKGPDERKIKVLNKKHTAREGTFRATMLEDLFASKTVAEFRAKDSKYDAGCLKFAVDAGYVSVG